MSGQAWFGVAIAAWLYVLLVVAADVLDRRDRREDAVRFDPDGDLPPVRRTGRPYPFALSYRAGEEPPVELELLGHRKPRQQSVEEWINDVLGPAPEVRP